MKRIHVYITALLLGAVMWSCSDDKLNSDSIFVDPTKAKTPFDNYLYREFVVPYNVEIKYRMEDIETDLDYNVIPAKEESSKALAVLMKHLWIDVYNEASPEGVNFCRQYATRVVHFIGSGQFSSSGTVLGTAEGGKKITMTDVNAINPNNSATFSPTVLLRHYGKFHVIHHEFAHILNQTRAYQTTFPQISGGYVGTDWINIDTNGSDEAGYPEAHSAGFVSPYAMMDEGEDFVETYSIYITKSAAGWERFLSDASANGRSIINRKVEMVREYMKDSWGMDLDGIRAIVQRRASEITELEFSDLK